MVSLVAVALLCIAAGAITANLIARSSLDEYFTECYRMGGRMGGPCQPTSRGALSAINKGFLIASLVGLGLALVVSFFVARELAKPVGELTEAARGIGAGDLSKRVSARGGRELEELGDAFNELAEGLETSERLRSHMVQDIAHELRNPLATMKAQIEAIQDGVVEPGSEAIASLAEDVDVLSRLVDDLHQLSMAEAGQIELERMAVEVGEALEGTATKFSAAAESGGVTVAVDVEEGLPEAFADPIRLSQVLSNLVKNSVSHTPRGGSVTLSARRSGEMIELSVRDTGSGIASGDLPYVFERFYRAEPARERETGGAGIGLTVAKSLVEAHGGSIGVESTPGEGTLVTFTLPVC